MTSPSFDFDFVISYASEDNDNAEKLYEALTSGGAKVFYAPEYSAEIWGKNLYEYLAGIYNKKGRFCIPLVSEHYVKKQWTRHEWKSAQERILASIDIEYVLPIRLDNSDLPGLLATIAYQSINLKSIEAIAELALEKLQNYKHEHQMAPIIYEVDWTTTIFHKRLAQALPGKRGLHTISDPMKIAHILKTVLQEPLAFTVIMEDGSEHLISDAIWWWREHRALPIQEFNVLDKGIYLINVDELAVVQVQQYCDDAETDLSFLYIKCNPLPPVFRTQDEITHQITNYGYTAEHLGYISSLDKYIMGEEYEDGYTEIEGEVKSIRAESELRRRYISPYDFFIAPKETRMNSTSGGKILKLFQNKLLRGEASMESFIEQLQQLPPSEYRNRLPQ